MNKLKAKLKNARGFTLVEMLIVVAIIAILVAVSIPVVSSSLEKSKKATDDANIRSAKAAATIEFFEGNIKFTSGSATLYYNGKEGKVEQLAEAPDKGDEGYDYGQAGENNKEYIIITVTEDGTITPSWSNLVS